MNFYPHQYRHLSHTTLNLNSKTYIGTLLCHNKNEILMRVFPNDLKTNWLTAFLYFHYFDFWRTWKDNTFERPLHISTKLLYTIHQYFISFKLVLKKKLTSLNELFNLHDPSCFWVTSLIKGLYIECIENIL